MGSLFIPEDCSKTKYLFRNGTHTGIGITVRWTPIFRESTPGRVMDELHSPTKLAEYLEAGKRSHVRMSPCMHANVVWHN